METKSGILKVTDGNGNWLKEYDQAVITVLLDTHEEIQKVMDKLDLSQDTENLERITIMFQLEPTQKQFRYIFIGACFFSAQDENEPQDEYDSIKEALESVVCLDMEHEKLVNTETPVTRNFPTRKDFGDWLIKEYGLEKFFEKEMKKLENR